MLMYEEDELVIIPMAINAFYSNIGYGTKEIKYTKLVSISSAFLQDMVKYLNKLPDGKCIVIDLSNADYSFRYFEFFQSVGKTVLFVNIDPDILYGKMKDNLPGIKFSRDRKFASLNIDYEDSVDEVCKKVSSEVNDKIYANIIKELIEEVPKNPVTPLKLDSSGLYSNMYVNVKKLFLCPEKYYAVLYGMAKLVKDSDFMFDGFVSSSKNGAMLAYLLGMMLGKKAIHISGIGPKYSMIPGTIQKEVKRRKNYIYVFDFRCTGTEMKILSSLINANEAYIKGAVGIAVYRDEHNDNDKPILSLMSVKKQGIPYKIAGEPDDIIRLVKEEEGNKNGGE